jgi:tetratricopeptide (TPR) repeat protein
LLTIASSFSGLRADHITTIDGQTLEGIIRDENRFNVTLDVRGILMPIPRERIKEITKASLDDNVRSLLDRALEARSRDDLNTARTLIEQARALNSRNPTLIDNLRQQDKELTDLEKRGGTPEARRARAAVLLQRANDAYDKVRIDEGNTLLLQALKTDPTYDDAQKRIIDLLTTSKNVDTEMAAEYFAEAFWPDHVTPDNPVIKLLPEIYSDLANRFDLGTDIPKAQRYAELLKIIHDAFQQQSQWTANADAATKAMIEKPLDQLLAEMVARNLQRGNAEFALQKLQGWADPTASPGMALLFVRAHVGAGNFEQAADVLQKAVDAFPSDSTLQPHLNALKLMVEAQTAQKLGNTELAQANYEKVFAARGSLSAEIGEVVGRNLADIKYQQLAAMQPGGPPPTGFTTADISAQVLQFSTERNRQRKAAEVLASALPRIPWRMDLSMNINNTALTLAPELKGKAEAALSKPLNVLFDDQSPFVIKMNVKFLVQESSATQVVQAVTPGGAGLAAPMKVGALNFTVTATHPSLGTLIKQSWTETAVPEAVRARHEGVAVLQNMDSIDAFVGQDLADYLIARMGLLNSRIQIPKIQELLGPQALR